MKFNQLIFIKNLIIKEELINYNTNIIPMKARSIIEMINKDDYKETKLYKYQQLIGKLMYLAYEIRPNIAFAVY